jgi:hypothetical protein
MRLPATGGKWLDAKGRKVPAGSGYWKPDRSSKLYDALRRHQKPVVGIPFKDGRVDFSSFPPKGFPETPRVRIEMSGDSAKDIRAAAAEYRRTKRKETIGEGATGTWHHDVDGGTMIYVDKKIHHAHDGSPGTPHLGGDWMTNHPEF